MPQIQWLEHLRGDGVYSLRAAQSSLLQVLLTEFELSRDGHGLVLKVSFGESDTTIRRREAKKRVESEMPGYPGKVADIQDRIDAVIFRGESHFKHNDPEFAFRYASGGTLPIVVLDSRDYYCLFYRDVTPVGWNIANGACDSLPELLNPRRAIERELREELIILALHTSPPLDYTCTWGGQIAIVVPEFEYARRLARTFLAEEFDINKNFEKEPLEVTWTPIGPDALQVSYAEQDAKIHKGFYLNINAKDFGIELDRIARIKLPLGVVLLSGEINDNRLLNEPIGLFEVGKTQEAVQAGCTEFIPDRLYYGAAPFSPVPSAAEFRADIVRRKFLARLLHIGARSAERVAEWESLPLSACFDLCPVTRSIIRRHIDTTGLVIFVSYSHMDRPFAEQLEKDLKGCNVNVWLDVKDMHPSRRIDTAVKEAIEGSSHVLLLASEHSADSEFVRNELQHANDLRKPGIVVMQKRLESRALPLQVNTWMRIDFEQRYPEGLRELVRALRFPATD